MGKTISFPRVSYKLFISTLLVKASTVRSPSVRCLGHYHQINAVRRTQQQQFNGLSLIRYEQQFLFRIRVQLLRFIMRGETPKPCLQVTIFSDKNTQNHCDVQKFYGYERLNSFRTTAPFFGDKVLRIRVSPRGDCSPQSIKVTFFYPTPTPASPKRENGII